MTSEIVYFIELKQINLHWNRLDHCWAFSSISKIIGCKITFKCNFPLSVTPQKHSSVVIIVTDQIFKVSFVFYLGRNGWKVMFKIHKLLYYKQNCFFFFKFSLFHNVPLTQSRCNQKIFWSKWNYSCQWTIYAQKNYYYAIICLGLWTLNIISRRW